MWTLTRHRNGQEVPIKVSVLDVFRSGSGRGRKPGEESQRVKPKANTKATVAPKAQTGGGNNTTGNYNKTSWSTPDNEIWTEEDDNQLRNLKGSGNMSWKEILANLSDKHTSETQMKARFKEIEARAIGGTVTGGASDDKTKRGEDKKAKADKAKAEGLAKQAAAKAGKAEPKKGIVKTSNTKSATFQERELKDVAAKYDKDKWLAVASRHFDQTGQRISPEMARAMCGATD